jgi:DNA-binding SARP family transcriptional activator/Tfp pilus assembly protein PilF
MQQRVSPSRLTNVVPLAAGQADFARRKATAPILRIHLLGAMRASTVRHHLDILPRGRKARALLAYLCLAGGAPVLRSRLAAMLWDRVPAWQARASFRQAFRELTIAFGELTGDVLAADRDTVRLDTGACWIDAVALLSDQPGADDVRGNLAQLCKGALLEDLTEVSEAFDQWMLERRSGFAENLRKLLEVRLEQATDRAGSEPSLREEIAERLIRFDPTHEGASRILMRARADRKHRVSALKEYQRLHDALERAFGVEPSAETRALYEAIREFAEEEWPDKALTAPAARKDTSAKADPAAPKRSNRRVGVMPFIPVRSDLNLGFAIAQEVAAALGRCRWFDVVAPNSLMRTRAPTFVSDVELRRKDLDYVIDGSVVCSRGKYCIHVHLLDFTSDAKPVWSRRFELPVDRLDLLDESVIGPIAAEIDPVIIYIEGRPKKRDEDDDALSCVMRALPLLHTLEKTQFEQAGRLIERARALDPDNAVVLCWAAYWHVFYMGQNWTDNPQRESETALAYAARATVLDERNAEALAIYGHLKSFLKGDVEIARQYLDRALQLNPDVPFVLTYSALNHCYRGDPDTALMQLERCRELTSTLPYSSLYENPIAIARLMKGNYADAVEIGRRVVQGTPFYSNGYKPLIAALGHLRRRKEAKRYVERLRELEPDFTVKKFGESYPMRDSHREHYMDGLRRAGVPES